MKTLVESIEELVIHQVSNYWTEIDKSSIISAVPRALYFMEENYRYSPNKRFWDDKDVIFSPYVSVQWMIFLYRLSHELYLNGEIKSADQVYYLNKIMHSNDWFYAIDLPVHFQCEHPIGSVLGRAKYGDYFFIYQGTTVGGNRTHGELFYPTIGNNVILFANATVLGDTHIGNNVIISSGTYIINQKIPDNCIVFGKSPDIIIKEKSEKEIKTYSKHIWGW